MIVYTYSPIIIFFSVDRVVRLGPCNDFAAGTHYDVFRIIDLALCTPSVIVIDGPCGL